MGKNVKNKQTKLLALALLIAPACLIFGYLFKNYISSHDTTEKPSTELIGSKNPRITKTSTEETKNHSYENQYQGNDASSVKSNVINKSIAAVPDLSTRTFKTPSGEIYPLRTYKTLSVNDPLGNQWWTTSTNLDTAWNIGAGSTQTIIAIIDTGFSLGHEEFSNRWAINSNEQGATSNQSASKLNCSGRSITLNKSCNLIDDGYDGVVDNFTVDPYEVGATSFENPSQLNCSDRYIAIDKSCNMIDDDGNGYVDDVKGWDFANFDSNVQAGQTNPYGSGTTHGTEVSGVLAATGNNNKGIAGVNWSTKILPIQAIDDDSYGNTMTVARAIYYAAERGVDAISLSLGSDQEDNFLRQAVQYALDRNIIIVAASGNDGCNCISYPARYPEVLSVGSHNSSMNTSNFSNYGSELDISAPGENITTTNWTRLNQTSAYINGVNGTSFSTPYVAGLLGLARSHQPNATWGELISSLASTSNHTGLTVTNPTSINIGSGYVNAGNLINRVTNQASSTIKYSFWPIKITGTLSSNRVFQCNLASDFPTTLFYEITGSTSTFYTIDTLESIRAVARGNAVRNLGRLCVGLPGDTSSTLRSINLLSEIKNIQNFKSF